VFRGLLDPIPETVDEHEFTVVYPEKNRRSTCCRGIDKHGGGRRWNFLRMKSGNIGKRNFLVAGFGAYIVKGCLTLSNIERNTNQGMSTSVAY
jgi:hypothetical protein